MYLFSSLSGINTKNKTNNEILLVRNPLMCLNRITPFGIWNDYYYNN